MIDDLSDKEQIELFKKWWKQYGWGLLFAILLGLTLGYGWRYWHQHQAERNMQASSLYMQLVAIKDSSSDKAKEIVALLDQRYHATPYASFAHLFLAKQEVTGEHYAKAMDQLTWVQEHGSMEALKNLASLRKARILLNNHHYEKALTELTAVKGDDYQGQVTLIQGDIYAAQGKDEQARKAYRQAQASLSKLGVSDPILGMKLIQLGEAVSAQGDA